MNSKKFACYECAIAKSSQSFTLIICHFAGSRKNMAFQRKIKIKTTIPNQSTCATDSNFLSETALHKSRNYIDSYSKSLVCERNRHGRSHPNGSVRFRQHHHPCYLYHYCCKLLYNCSSSTVVKYTLIKKLQNLFSIQGRNKIHNRFWKVST